MGLFTRILRFISDLQACFKCTLSLLRNLCWQVLSDEGMAKSIAFDEIDKAPEEKQRGITIATVSTLDLLFMSITTNI